MDVHSETISRVRVVEKSAFDHEVLFSKPFSSREEAETFVQKQDNNDTVFEIEGDE